MPLSGLRISWLMFATNSVFAALAFASWAVRWPTFSSSSALRRRSARTRSR